VKDLVSELKRSIDAPPIVLLAARPNKPTSRDEKRLKMEKAKALLRGLILFQIYFNLLVAGAILISQFLRST
jgi:hypothetical protein